MHNFLHALVHREGSLEQHRAGGVGLEGAHREFAALESHGVAAGIKAFETELAQPGKEAAHISIHHLVGFQLEVVSGQERIARGEDERETQPPLASTDDASTSEASGG